MRRGLEWQLAPQDAVDVASSCDCRWMEMPLHNLLNIASGLHPLDVDSQGSLERWSALGEDLGPKSQAEVVPRA